VCHLRKTASLEHVVRYTHVLNGDGSVSMSVCLLTIAENTFKSMIIPERALFVNVASQLYRTLYRIHILTPSRAGRAD